VGLPGLVFASSVFQPVASMPLAADFARNQPITQAVNAMRDLTQGGVYGGGQYVWHTLL